MFIAALATKNLSPVGTACISTVPKTLSKIPKLTPMVRLQTAPTGPGKIRITDLNKIQLHGVASTEKRHLCYVFNIAYRMHQCQGGLPIFPEAVSHQQSGKWFPSIGVAIERLLLQARKIV